MTNLPVTKRYNFRLFWKHQRMARKMWMLTVAGLLAYLAYQGQLLVISNAEAAKFEQAYMDLKIDVMSVSQFGAPKSVTDDDFEPEMKK